MVEDEAERLELVDGRIQLRLGPQAAPPAGRGRSGRPSEAAGEVVELAAQRPETGHDRGARQCSQVPDAGAARRRGSGPPALAPAGAGSGAAPGRPPPRPRCRPGWPPARRSHGPSRPPRRPQTGCCRCPLGAPRAGAPPRPPGHAPVRVASSPHSRSGPRCRRARPKAAAVRSVSPSIPGVNAASASRTASKAAAYAADRPRGRSPQGRAGGPPPAAAPADAEACRGRAAIGTLPGSHGRRQDERRGRCPGQAQAGQLEPEREVWARRGAGGAWSMVTSGVGGFWTWRAGGGLLPHLVMEGRGPGLRPEPGSRQVRPPLCRQAGSGGRAARTQAALAVARDSAASRSRATPAARSPSSR